MVGALATIHYKCWTWLGQRVFGEIRRRKGGASVEINKSETPFIMYVCMYVCISMYVFMYFRRFPLSLPLFHVCVFLCMYIFIFCSEVKKKMAISGLFSARDSYRA